MKTANDVDHLVIQRGKVFNLLGMRLEIMPDKRIKISMKDHVEEALEMFGEAITGTVSTPHTKRLFDVTPAKELDSNRSEIFHSVVAKLLFIMKRSNPDIETAISFLMTRVTKSDEEDWKKLKQVLTFLKQNVDDP